MKKAAQKPVRLARALKRMDHGILRAYVHFCPIATQINLTSPGIAGLAVIALLPR